MDSDVATLAYRLGQIERKQEDVCEDVEQISRRQDSVEREVAVHTEQISGAGGLVNAMERLGSKVDSLNKALYTFALSFIVAALGIAASIGFH